MRIASARMVIVAMATASTLQTVGAPGAIAADGASATAAAWSERTLEVISEAGGTGDDVVVLTAVLSSPASVNPSEVRAEIERINFEIEQGPNDQDGNTPMSPDLSCIVPPTATECYAPYIDEHEGEPGFDVIRAWIDLDQILLTVEADQDEGRNAGASDCISGDPADACADPGVPGAINEPDQTDVVAPKGPLNEQPNAIGDLAETSKNRPVTIPVLANDSDPDGDPLMVTAVTAPLWGSARIADDGTVTYTPNRGFRGTDSFTYTISDRRGGSGTADVTVNVTPRL